MKSIPNHIVLVFLAGVLFLNLFFGNKVLDFLSFLTLVYFLYLSLVNEETSRNNSYNSRSTDDSIDGSSGEAGPLTDLIHYEEPITAPVGTIYEDEKKGGENITIEPTINLNEKDIKISLKEIIRIIESIDENIDSLPSKEALMFFLVMKIYEAIQHYDRVDIIDEKDGYDPDFHILVPMEWGTAEGTPVDVIRPGISTDGVAQIRALVKKLLP